MVIALCVFSGLCSAVAAGLIFAAHGLMRVANWYDVRRVRYIVWRDLSRTSPPR